MSTREKVLIPPVSIVIPTLNEQHHLPLLLDSLLLISSPIEIIVVDGNSVDATKDVVREYANRFGAHTTVRLVDSPKRNIAVQRNLGARMALHPTLLFLDSDVIIPSEGSFTDLISEFVTSGFVAANAKLVAHPQEKTIFAGFIFAFVRGFQRCMISFNRPYFGGACIVTSSDTFSRINGFNELLSIAEDVDFGLRAQKHGQCGFLTVEISTSTRRLKKTGRREAWAFAKALPSLLRTGRAPEDLVPFYTFGDY